MKKMQTKEKKGRCDVQEVKEKDLECVMANGVGTGVCLSCGAGCEN